LACVIQRISHECRADVSRVKTILQSKKERLAADIQFKRGGSTSERRDRSQKIEQFIWRK
jgi:hypothetical protein